MITPYSISYIFPYFLFFIIYFIGNFKISNNQNFQIKGSYNLLHLYICIIAYLIFFGLHGFLFTDYLSYYPMFQAVPTLFSGKAEVDYFFTESDFYRMEKGFFLFMRLIKSIWPNYFFFQFLSVLIDYILLVTFFKNYLKKDFSLAFCFFFIFNGAVIEINLMRNVKAILLFLLSLKQLENKKYLEYFLLNLLGYTFHSSALIYLLLTPFYYKKIPDKLILFSFIIGNIFFFLHIKWISQILLFSSQFLPKRVRFIIRMYINANKSSYGLSIGYIERFMTFWIMYFLMKKKYDNKEIRVMFNCIFFYLFLYLFCTELVIIQDRVGSLFVFSYWILYPLFYKELKKDWKIIFLLLFLLYACAKIYSTYRFNIHCFDFCFNLKYDFRTRVDSVNYYFHHLQK